MKGFFFQRPVEFHLFAEGEEWVQGDQIHGTLRVKNLENDSVNLEMLQVGLAYGVFKKIKAKDTDAWSKIQTQVLAQNITVSPQEEQHYRWVLDLAADYPITDNIGSLFLFYGDQNLYSQGRIDVRMKLFPFLQSFLQTFETQFRFQKKYEKSKLEFTEVKLIPPDSREFPTLDHILCLLRIHEGMMEVHYNFKMKSLGRNVEQDKMEVIRKKREHQQKFTETQYAQGGFPNRECYRQAIQEALEVAKPEALF